MYIIILFEMPTFWENTIYINCHHQCRLQALDFAQTCGHFITFLSFCSLIRILHILRQNQRSNSVSLTLYVFVNAKIFPLPGNDQLNQVRVSVFSQALSAISIMRMYPHQHQRPIHSLHSQTLANVQIAEEETAGNNCD